MKIIKGFFNWIWEAIKESIAQVWTLLGFFIAWLTLNWNSTRRGWTSNNCSHYYLVSNNTA
jgi:hypothetical protein